VGSEVAPCLKHAARAARNSGAAPAVHAVTNGSAICVAHAAVLAPWRL
jgi:hypothetical protein